MHNSRKQSAKLGFLVLRQRLCTVQAVVQGKDPTAFLCGLPKARACCGRRRSKGS